MSSSADRSAKCWARCAVTTTETAANPSAAPVRCTMVRKTMLVGHQALRQDVDRAAEHGEHDEAHAERADAQHQGELRIRQVDVQLAEREGGAAHEKEPQDGDRPGPDELPQNARTAGYR